MLTKKSPRIRSRMRRPLIHWSIVIPGYSLPGCTSAIPDSASPRQWVGVILGEPLDSLPQLVQFVTKIFDPQKSSSKHDVDDVAGDNLAIPGLMEFDIE